ncbi:TetR/AcrR family transcriptional regulator [Hyalangium versicolor]|uniref:TetR/AcrR family transcriptional regulator n=1 Tax=Hyalangium versicolor TaxID=2861190 RepID=UPI001CC95789|nr:TetR/AcrR family transcriptional regulator [Hyalangium versicolor]
MSASKSAPRRERKQSPSAQDSADALRADARRNRDRVLEVARELFASKGLAVGMDDIAKEAGVGVGTVYRHFPTKESLFQAAVLSHMEALIEDARSLMEAADPGQAFFDFLERLVEQGTAKKNLIDTLAQGGVKVAAAPPELSREFRRAVDALLTRAQEAGAVREDIEASEIVALVGGVFTAVQRMGGDSRSRRRMFDVMCDGLRVRPSPQGKL